MDGIILMGQITFSEAEEWICNMERVMEDTKVNPKEKVKYASWYFIRKANTWWKMRIAVDESQMAITWEQFKESLLQFRLVIWI
jgi:hypothetical protein